MYKNKRILAVVTARGGSKGLPGKNIKVLAGKPLITWTIEAAIRSKYLDRIIISTDDESIAAIAKNNGAEVPFLRPDELASDQASSVDVVIHAIDFLKNEEDLFDYVALLEPTSPLRAEHDIDRAIEALVNAGNNADSLVTLGKIELEHPWTAKLVNEDGFMMPYVNNAGPVTRRQELRDAYFPYGVIYLASIQSLYINRSFYPQRTLPLFVERWQCYEINDLCDFVVVDAIMKKRLMKKL